MCFKSFNCCSKCPIFSQYVWIHRCKIFHTVSNGLLNYLNLPRVNPEKAMAPHSSTLAWKIPWTEEPGRLQSMGSLRIRHDWATSLSLFTFMHWRRKWQPTPVFLPGESQRWGSLVGFRLWGRTESDTTEATCSSSSSRVNPWTMAGIRAPALLCINWVPINQSRMFSFKWKPNSFGYDI